MKQALIAAICVGLLITLPATPGLAQGPAAKSAAKRSGAKRSAVQRRQSTEFVAIPRRQRRSSPPSTRVMPRRSLRCGPKTVSTLTRPDAASSAAMQSKRATPSSLPKTPVSRYALRSIRCDWWARTWPSKMAAPSLEPASDDAAGMSRYTAVHANVGGKWLMASVRDTWIEPPAAVRSAADLEWLIGTWTAEEHGVQTESAFRWVVDGRFIERTYTTTQVDGTKTSGLQLIGWNPQGGARPVVGFQPRRRARCWRMEPDRKWLAGEGNWDHRRRRFHRRGESAHTSRRQRLRVAVGAAFPGGNGVAGHGRSRHQASGGEVSQRFQFFHA